MEAIQKSIEALSLHFNSQMDEFQKNLQGAIPAASPTSNIASQFSTFRTFVLTALSGLQQQVELLARQTDQLEMHSRRKMLLIHGISESSDDNLSATVRASLAKFIKIPDLQANFSRCQRLGRSKGDKPRPILLKFQEMSTRDKVWFAKSALKSTGITLSEFLTRNRHEAFMLARDKFGVSKSWTSQGVIVVIGHDGSRHRATTKAEINSIQAHSDSHDSSAPASSANAASKASKTIKPSVSVNISERSKRNVKK